MAKPGSKEQEVLQFLDSLDSSFPTPPPSTTPATGGGKTAIPDPQAGEAAEALAFLEEITQKKPEPQRITITPRSGTPILRKGSEIAAAANGRRSTDSVRRPAEASAAAAGSSGPSTPKSAPTATGAAAPASAQQQQGGWGWGSVWSLGSAAIQQARTVVDEQVKKNEQARKWQEGMLEYVKHADKIGQGIKDAGFSTFMDIVNAVAPPIAEHEVINVWLSHDMQGYEGVENLVYRALARIMEQVEGGDLVVNKGDESRPKEAEGITPVSERNFNTLEGFEPAMKLAKANLEELVRKHAAKPVPESPKESNILNPTTHSTVFLRIQPYTSSPFSSAPKTTPAGGEEEENLQQMQFILHMVDPSHSLTHTTVTQCVPVRWVAMWDDPGCEWVEDLVVEVLRVGVEVIGQQYLVKRMGWESKGKGKAKAKEDSGETEKPSV